MLKLPVGEAKMSLGHGCFSGCLEPSVHACRAQKESLLATNTSTTTNGERRRLETLNTRLKGADGSQTAMNTRAQNHGDCGPK